MNATLPDQPPESLPVIAILRGIRPEQVIPVCEILLSFQIHWIEIPLNSPEPFESISKAVRAFSDQAVIGAGTVLSVQDVNRLGDIGARLVVAPNTDPEIIAAARRLDMHALPGAMSPTEVLTAASAGATAVKLFPARSVGADHIRDLRAVIPPSLPLIPVGGISAGNIRMWLNAGASAVGVGTALFEPDDTTEIFATKVSRLHDAISGSSDS